MRYRYVPLFWLSIHTCLACLDTGGARHRTIALLQDAQLSVAFQAGPAACAHTFIRLMPHGRQAC